VADSRPARAGRTPANSTRSNGPSSPISARLDASAHDHPFLAKGDGNEANVSAPQPQQAPHPRLPKAYGNEGWARCPQEPAPEGALAAHRDRLPEVVTGARPVGRFPAAQRVKKRLEFEAAQGSGRKATLPHFVLLLYARAESGEARLGIVASRRVGTATVRNRAKRLIREAFRATRELFLPGMDVVVIVRRPLEGMKLDDVRNEWKSREDVVRRRTVEAQRDRTARGELPAPRAAPRPS
jgi:ribonuclease P protein component